MQIEMEGMLDAKRSPRKVSSNANEFSSQNAAVGSHGPMLNMDASQRLKKMEEAIQLHSKQAKN